tara:strand:- start:48304 stop:49509 length:1206 start_codon:yes stop_codon:yes gene_type:complete
MASYLSHVAVLMLSLSCSSGASSKPDAAEEFCDLNTAADEPNPDVVYNVDVVYDVLLRDPTSDPNYGIHIPFLFADPEGVTAFTESSLVRTSLGGTVTSTNSYDNRRLEKAVETDTGFAATFSRPNSQDAPILCTIPRHEPIDFNACTSVSSHRFAWLSPYYYFLEFTSEVPPLWAAITVLNEAKEVVHHSNVLRLDARADLLFLTGIDTIEGKLVVHSNRSDEFYCYIPTFASLSPLGPEGSLLAAEFTDALPSGYTMSGFFTETAGNDRSAFSYRAEVCVNAQFACTPSRDAHVLSIFDGKSVVTRELANWPGQIHPISGGFTKLHVQDDPMGVDGFYSLHMFDLQARPTGKAIWPTEPFVGILDYNMAEISQGDIVVAFSISGIAPQDRLMRIRLSSN